jgi:hypothetical protein
MDAIIKKDFSTPALEHLFELYKESKLNIDATYTVNLKVATGVADRPSKEEKRIIQNNELD